MAVVAHLENGATSPLLWFPISKQAVPPAHVEDCPVPENLRDLPLLLHFLIPRPVIPDFPVSGVGKLKPGNPDFPVPGGILKPGTIL